MEELNNGKVEGQDNGTQVKDDEQKTYTKEEVEKLLQQETDRRVTSALKKAEEKNQAKVREAQKLAQMNEQQKYEYELQQREAAIAAKEKELALAENKNEASKILAEKGLSLELVNFVVAEEASSMNDNIKLLERAFKASVKAEVEKRLGSSAPKKNLADETSMTKEALMKMSLTDIQRFKDENPTLFNSLMG